MPESTPEPTPVPPAKEKRGTPQIISRGTLADIKLAEACANVATQTGNMVALSALCAAVQRARELCGQITTSRSKKQRRTSEEENALTAFDPVTTCAKRTFPGDDQPERRLFGVGLHLANCSTPLPHNLTGNIHAHLIAGSNPQPEYTLKGLKPAEITVLGTLAAQYNDADFVQSTATQSAGELLLTPNKHLRETLNPLRRELQLAAAPSGPGATQTTPAKEKPSASRRTGRLGNSFEK